MSSRSPRLGNGVDDLPGIRAGEFHNVGINVSVAIEVNAGPRQCRVELPVIDVNEHCLDGLSFRVNPFNVVVQILSRSLEGQGFTTQWRS
jgi:hypothetical protein